MYCLLKKCKLLKEKAKVWSTNRFGNIFLQLRTIETKLRSIQESLLLNPDCPNLCLKQNKFVSKQTRLLEFQEAHWKIKAKSNHLKISDSNTKYYHACASIRRNRNLKTSIENEVGTVVSYLKQMESCFTNSFIRRFTSNSE